MKVSEISERYTFVSDSQDVKIINDDCNTDFDAFFVLIHEGEYISIYGMYGIVPELNKRLYHVR